MREREALEVALVQVPAKSAAGHQGPVIVMIIIMIIMMLTMMIKMMINNASI